MIGLIAAVPNAVNSVRPPLSVQYIVLSGFLTGASSNNGAPRLERFNQVRLIYWHWRPD
jgi:hypothetical protein